MRLRIRQRRLRRWKRIRTRRWRWIRIGIVSSDEDGSTHGVTSITRGPAAWSLGSALVLLSLRDTTMRRAQSFTRCMYGDSGISLQNQGGAHAKSQTTQKESWAQ